MPESQFFDNQGGSYELQMYRKRLAILTVFKLVSEELLEMAESGREADIQESSANIKAGRNMLSEYWSGVNSDFKPVEKSPLDMIIMFKYFDDQGEVVDWKSESEVRNMILSNADKIAAALDQPKRTQRSLRIIAGSIERHLYRILLAYSEDWLRCSAELT